MNFIFAKIKCLLETDNSDNQKDFFGSPLSDFDAENWHEHPEALDIYNHMHTNYLPYLAHAAHMGNNVFSNDRPAVRTDDTYALRKFMGFTPTQAAKDKLNKKTIEKSKEFLQHMPANPSHFFTKISDYYQQHEKNPNYLIKNNKTDYPFPRHHKIKDEHTRNLNQTFADFLIDSNENLHPEVLSKLENFASDAVMNPSIAKASKVDKKDLDQFLNNYFDHKYYTSDNSDINTIKDILSLPVGDKKAANIFYKHIADLADDKFFTHTVFNNKQPNSTGSSFYPTNREAAILKKHLTPSLIQHILTNAHSEDTFLPALKHAKLHDRNLETALPKLSDFGLREVILTNNNLTTKQIDRIHQHLEQDPARKYLATELLHQPNISPQLRHNLIVEQPFKAIATIDSIPNEYLTKYLNRTGAMQVIHDTANNDYLHHMVFQKELSPENIDTIINYNVDNNLNNGNEMRNLTNQQLEKFSQQSAKKLYNYAAKLATGNKGYDFWDSIADMLIHKAKQ